MTKCNCCNKIKFDFQFPSENYWWLATVVYTICNKCVQIESAKILLDKFK
jgi:hypothetical protein